MRHFELLGFLVPVNEVGTPVPAERQLRHSDICSNHREKDLVGTPVPAERQLRRATEQLANGVQELVGTPVPAERQLRLPLCKDFRSDVLGEVGTPVPAERQLRRLELVALMFPNQKAVVRLDFTFGISS